MTSEIVVSGDLKSVHIPVYEHADGLTGTAGGKTVGSVFPERVPARREREEAPQSS